MSKRAPGDASIRKRPDGRFEWKYPAGRDPKTGKQIRKSVYGKTFEECLIKKKGIITEQGTYGKILKPASMTLETWLNEWLSVYCGNLAESTRRKYERDSANNIVPYLGQARLKDLSNTNIQEWINELSEKISPKTTRNVYGTLHKALQKAVDVGIIRESPAVNIELPKKEKVVIQTLPESLHGEFMRALDGDPYRIPILLCLFTGLRIGEVVGLTWPCVNLEWNNMTIRYQLIGGKTDAHLAPPKHDRIRIVPLPRQAVELLQEQKEIQKKQAAHPLGWYCNSLDLVFTDEYGFPLIKQSIRKHCKKAFAEIGCPDLRVHDLRHTYAVDMIRAGNEFKTISENMGHSSVAFTMDRYAHVTKEMEQESAKRQTAFLDSLPL